MTILDDTANAIIAEVGETVTVVPHNGYQTDADGIWPSDGGYDTANSFEADARVLRAISNDELEEEGFSNKGEILMYFGDKTVEEGDKILFDNKEWVVFETSTDQLGNGPYRQNCTVVSEEK